MGVKAEVVCQPNVALLDVQCFAKGSDVHEVIEDVISVSQFDELPDLVSVELSDCQGVSSQFFELRIFSLFDHLLVDACLWVCCFFWSLRISPLIFLEFRDLYSSVEFCAYV